MAAGASVMATSFSELPAGIDLRMNWQVGEDGFSWPDNRPLFIQSQNDRTPQSWRERRDSNPRPPA